MHKIIPADKNGLSKAINELQTGNVVVFPTETVYGLGGNAYDDAVVAKIFQYKNRESFKPISVCYSDIMAASDDVEITNLAIEIAKHFLPGPLTLILKKKKESRISWLCSAGSNTIGIRIPANEFLLSMLKNLEFPIAAPSANESLTLSATTALDVSHSLKNIENLLIFDGGNSQIGMESTIIDISSDNCCEIIRVGALNIDMIQKKCGISMINQSLGNCKKKSIYKIHIEIIENAICCNDDDALLAFGRPIKNNSLHVLNLSEKSDLTEAASNFFSMLKILTLTNAKRICIMPIPNEGLGTAINEKISVLQSI